MVIRQIYWHVENCAAMGEDTFTFCPMCGRHLEQKILDHQPRRACPSCGYIHFRNPAPTVSLLIIQEDRVLLGIRPENPGRDSWATPSGYIEFGEDFLTTAVRETKEETGLDVAITAILNVTDSFFPPNQHFFNIYLLAQVSGGTLLPGDDMGELRWYPLCGPFPDMAFQEDIDMIDWYRRPGAQWLPIEHREL